MSTTTVDYSDVQLLQDLQSSSWNAVASFTWLTYDIIIAMDQEIEHIWKAKWSLGKVLYIIARYLAFAVLLFSLLRVSTLPAAVCKAAPPLTSTITVILGTSVDVVQLIRMRALYNGSRRVMLPLYLLFAGVIIGAIAVAAEVSSKLSLNPPPIGDDTCSPQYSNTLLEPTIPAWALQMALGGIFLVLTLVKLHQYLRVGVVPTPVLTTFVRDGVVVYAAIFSLVILCSTIDIVTHEHRAVAELVDVVILQAATNANRPNLIGVAAQWPIAVYGIAAPRLILNLRGVVSRPTTETTVIDTTLAGHLVEEVELQNRDTTQPLHSEASPPLERDV